MKINRNKVFATAWSNYVPLKTSALVWRIWKNKIPTRDNLIKRGILIESQNSSLFGCGKEESVSHVFFECSLSSGSWSKILRWLEISSVLHNAALMVFQFLFV
ncbi:unnamed protein product [Trifolium pratense]|uniref:Uncharacterized protein n=1 Tax=Trifolium pratense TaxID=57577 RepID=A0ACB0IHM1_TRIPR|nr:unnamed protein product [Trifolium pratense]